MTRAEAAEITALALADPDTGGAASDEERYSSDVHGGSLDDLAREAVEFLDSQAIRLTGQWPDTTRVVRDDGLHVLLADEYALLYDE